MHLDPYSVLVGFVGVVEIGVACALLAVVARRGAAGADDDRGPLRAWTGFVLAALSLVSWPVLYLWLQSLVPRWADVMCIQGVTRVGAGDPGPARFFAPLVAVAQATKPVLAFLAGTWLVLHRTDRRTGSAPLSGRLRGVLALLALVALVDASASLGALGIPKDDRSLSVGCCTFASAARDVRAPWPFSAWSPHAAAPFVTAAHLGLGAVLLLGTSAWRARTTTGRAWPRGAPLVVFAAAAAVPVGLAFLSTVLAPHLLGRPEHFCAYCALAETPESLLGVGLFLTGVFATGWAAVLATLGRPAVSEAPLAAAVAGWLRVAQVATACATAFVVGALALR